jgi:hypothetical protein
MGWGIFGGVFLWGWVRRGMAQAYYYATLGQAQAELGPPFTGQTSNGGSPNTAAYNALPDGAANPAGPGLLSPYPSAAVGEIFLNWFDLGDPNGTGPLPLGTGPYNPGQVPYFPGQTLTSQIHRLYPIYVLTNIRYFPTLADATAAVGTPPGPAQTSFGGNYPGGPATTMVELIANNTNTTPYFYLASPYSPGPGYTLPFVNWGVVTNQPAGPTTFNPGDQPSDPITYYYYLYPEWTVICFREGSTILVHEHGEDVRRPVETLRPGTLVKTSRDGYLPISVIGHSQIYNPANTQRSRNRLYKLSPSQYPELTEDLYVTGCHSILVDSLTTKQEDEIREDYNTIFVTDRKFRLPAYLDDRAEPFAEEGNFTIWHFALEGEDERKNHGIYANGLLVETSFRKHVESRGGMTLVE